jgi:hypothetical protein
MSDANPTIEMSGFPIIDASGSFFFGLSAFHSIIIELLARRVARRRGRLA